MTMEGLKMEWKFTPGDLLQAALLLVALVAFAYNGHFRVQQVEKDIARIEKSIVEIRRDYLQKATFEREIAHIRESLDRIEGAVTK